MAGIFDRVLNREPKSAQQAKERLKLVLVHDRADIPPGVMDLLKDDLIAALSRHLEIDSTAVRIQIAKEGNIQRLIADIPLKPSRRRALG